MARVEYKVLNGNGLFGKNIERDLNKLAQEGWRVVGMGSSSRLLNAVIGTIILEREVDETTRRR